MTRPYNGGRDIVELAYHAKVCTATVYNFVSNRRHTQQRNVDRIRRAAAKASIRLPAAPASVWVY